jgi:hypothetical protein
VSIHPVVVEIPVRAEPTAPVPVEPEAWVSVTPLVLSIPDILSDIDLTRSGTDFHRYTVIETAV